MADPRHLKLLSEGSAVWNRQREKFQFTPDLSFADLRGQKFHGFDFCNTFFIGSILDFSTFTDCDFSNAIFGTPKSESANLENIFLSGSEHIMSETAHVWAEALSPKLRLFATGETTKLIREKTDIDVSYVKYPHEGRPHVVDIVKNGEIDCGISVVEGEPQKIQDSWSSRRVFCEQGKILLVSNHGVNKFIEDFNSTNFDLQNLIEQYLRPASALRSDFHKCNFENAMLHGLRSSGANLSTSISLTQAQLDYMHGSAKTLIPIELSEPKKWGDANEEKAQISIELVKSQIDQIRLLASTVADRIDDELDNLASSRPNHPSSISLKEDQERFLLSIRTLLDEISNNNTTDAEVATTLDKIKAEISEWLDHNIKEIVDTGIRIPALAGSIALLSLAGASMGPATIAAIALIGGPRVMKWYRQIKGK